MLDLWEYTELERRLNALCANTNGYQEFRQQAVYYGPARSNEPIFPVKKCCGQGARVRVVQA